MSDTKISEAVGIVGSMPGTEGFTMACFKADEVPVGTPLYLHPQPAELAEQQGVALRYLTQRELDSIGSQAEGMDGEQWDRWVQAKFAEVNGLATVDSDGFIALAATGKQQVGENPAWRDELVREAHARGLMEGLNSLRPQQVGEVQGDPLALIGGNLRSLASLVRQFATDADGIVVIANMQCEIKHAQELLAAALAAHEPGVG